MPAGADTKPAARIILDHRLAYNLVFGTKTEWDETIKLLNSHALNHLNDRPSGPAYVPAAVEVHRLVNCFFLIFVLRQAIQHSEEGKWAKFGNLLKQYLFRASYPLVKNGTDDFTTYGQYLKQDRDKKWPTNEIWNAIAAQRYKAPIAVMKGESHYYDELCPGVTVVEVPKIELKDPA